MVVKHLMVFGALAFLIFWTIRYLWNKGAKHLSIEHTLISLAWYAIRLSMRFRSAIVAWVIVGFLISLHGRMEVEGNAGFISMSESVSSLWDDNEAFPLNQPLPLGDHKDRHGCYHVHAPFIMTVGELPIQLSFFLFTADLSSPYSSPPSEVVPYPPRV